MLMFTVWSCPCVLWVHKCVCVGVAAGGDVMTCCKEVNHLFINIRAGPISAGGYVIIRYIDEQRVDW